MAMIAPLPGVGQSGHAVLMMNLTVPGGAQMRLRRNGGLDNRPETGASLYSGRRRYIAMECRRVMNSTVRVRAL